MNKCVILTEKEYRELPVLIARELVRAANKESGFQVVSKETGGPIVDRFEDWMTGTVSLAFGEVTKRLASSSSPTD